MGNPRGLGEAMPWVRVDEPGPSITGRTCGGNPGRNVAGWGIWVRTPTSGPVSSAPRSDTSRAIRPKRATLPLVQRSPCTIILIIQLYKYIIIQLIEFLVS